MRLKTILLTVGAAVILIGAVAVYRMGMPPGAQHSATTDFAVALTPPGVTLTALGDLRGPDGFVHVGGITRGVGSAIAFSDAAGMTFYTHDKDTEPGKSSCSGDCLKMWPAAMAPADAKPAGNWTIVVHDDGTKQWAYRNKPLYTFAKDEVPGDAKGDDSGKAWHAALLKPKGRDSYDPVALKSFMSEPFPYGISIQEVEEAGGQVLVDDLSHTLYAFDGDPTEDKPACADKAACGTSPWKPLWAAALARGIGNFTIVSRADGTRQWAFKGRPLYSYPGDVAANQTKGIGVDPRWKPALLVRYPTPAPVTIQAAPTIGKVFATLSGQSLYRQQIYYYTVAGHDFEHGVPYQEILGRAIGARGCESDCTKTWHPFTAAADARPSGYWSIVKRSDGTRQWAYKGYALYTFDGDRKPGDLLGLNSWNLSINDPALHSVSFLTSLKIDAEIMSGVQWTTAYP